MRWWDRHQIALYLLAIAAGAVAGLTVPRAAPALTHAINPVLALLLFATFLGVPLTEVGRGLRDLRFLGTVLITNFAAVPLVVWGLSRFVADDRGLLLGVLLVLLTPCVDYVIVFTGLAGGARARLLAATPLLMVAQILLLPVYLHAMAGPAAVEPGPFVEAFLVLIVLPLAAAAVVQAAGWRTVETVMAAAMVPLMMLTLAVVIASQIAAVGTRVGTLARVVPIYVAFVIIAVTIGRIAGRTGGLDAPATRAVVFSTATRNSLVVLPLALALPAELGIAALAVITQTLVELVAMVVLVRLSGVVRQRDQA